MTITVQVPTNIRPFHVDIPDEKLADLHRRIAAPATTVGRGGDDEPQAAVQPGVGEGEFRRRIAVGDAVNAAGDQGRRHESAGASANHRRLLGRHLTPV